MARKRFDRKPDRRLDAIERQAKWDALTVPEKLDILAERPGMCRKQIARLAA